MTPVQIEVALWYFCRSETMPNSSPAIQQAKAFLHSKRLLDNNTDTSIDLDFTPTDGLRAYVEALKAIPLPVRKIVWQIPETE